MAKKKKRLTLKEYAMAIWKAAVLSFRTAPAAVIFKMFGAVLNAVLPIILTYFAALTTTELAAAFTGNQAAGPRAINYVIITAILGLVTTIWTSIDGYIQGLLRYKVDARVTDMMYERFLALPFWRYDDKDTADTYDKAQKFAKFYSYVLDQITNIFSQLVSVITAIIALFAVVPIIGLVIVIALIPGIYFQFKVSRAQIEHWNKNIDKRRAQNFIEWQLLQPNSVTELRINNFVRFLLDLRNRYRDEDERQRLDLEKKYIGQQVASNVFESGVELGSLLWVTLQIINGTQPIGQFLYVQQIVSRAISSSNSIVGTISRIDEDLAQLFDYQKFMKYDLEATNTSELTAPVKTISFDDVSFRYFGSKETALDHISLTISVGHHIAIVGENGAGKSTLIKLLLGLYAPSSGTVLINGQDLRGITTASWHQQLSVLQQDFLHYIFANVRDNVYFGDVTDHFNAKRYKSAVEKSESDEFIAKLPKKEQTYPSAWMETDDGDKGVNLSGGQWQRLALARSFYREAPVIILDEPTSAIDALAESRIFDHLFKDKSRTIITISHRLTTVEKADIIFVLKEGKLVEQGTHDELVAKKGVYVTIFAAQLHRKKSS